MENVIVIITASDIPAAETVAATLSDYRVALFDPALLDKVLESTLSNVKFMKYQSSVEYSEVVKWSHSVANEIELELDTAVKKVLPEPSVLSWQHLNFYYLLLATKWYTSLWQEVLQHAVDTKFFVFVNDNPAQYYYPSYIPSMLLLQNLVNNNIEFSAFTYGKREDESLVVPDFNGSKEMSKTFDILAHLPTCFYDVKYFNDELKATGKKVISIQSKYWDTSIDPALKIGLSKIEDQMEMLSKSYQAKIDAFTHCIADKLDYLLKPFMNLPAYRLRQCQHISNLYKSQLVTFFLLKESFKHHKLSKVLISEHDAGFHGPIFSFAEKHNIPVIIVPHSKISADIEFGSNNSVFLTHPTQGECIADRNGRKVPSFIMAYPENFVGSSIFPEKIRRIGLLLNGISLNGVLSTQFSSYMCGIKEIHQWCQKNNVELGIRCRPGMTLFNALRDEIGIEQAALEGALSVTIEQFAKGYDLCLMYGTPTTASCVYLQNSIPILNPVSQDLSWTEASYSNAKVIPRGSVKTILNTLDSFLSDSTNFFVFRNTQFKEYINLFSSAYPLRSFL